MVSNNMIQNYLITVSYTANDHTIFIYDLVGLNGKEVRQNSEKVVTYSVIMPMDFLKHTNV